MLNLIDHPYQNFALASRASYRLNQTIEADNQIQVRNCMTARKLKPMPIQDNARECLMEQRQKIRGSAQGRRKIIIFNSKTEDTPPASAEVTGDINTSWMEPIELLDSSSSFERASPEKRPGTDPAHNSAGYRGSPLKAQSKPSSVLNSLTSAHKKKTPKLILKGRPVRVLPKIEESPRPTLYRSKKRTKRLASEKKMAPVIQTVDEFTSTDLPTMRIQASNFFQSPPHTMAGSQSARKLPSMQPTPAWPQVESCPYTQANTPNMSSIRPIQGRQSSALTFSRQRSARQLPTSSSTQNLLSARTQFSSQTPTTSQAAQMAPDGAFQIKLLRLSLERKVPDPMKQFSGHFTPLLKRRLSPTKLLKHKLNYGF